MRFVIVFGLSLISILLNAQETSMDAFPLVQPISVEKPDLSESNYFADSDEDGVRDDKDKCPNTQRNAYVDVFGCIILDDDDKDGVANKDDQCPQTPEEATVNLQGCEPDNDADGVPDRLDKCPNTEEGFLLDNFGCPQAKRLNITFEEKSSNLSEEFFPELEEFAYFLIENEDFQAIIYGYSDNFETPNNEKLLSQKRAKAVMEKIISYGVKLTRLTAIGMGNKNEMNQDDSQDNRKIEVELLQ